jgi:signal transduction histidine kinase/ActR/RegA family two-component response regulator
LPLISKGRLRGILEVFHRSSYTPEAEWLEYLETMAGQAAIAINNAQLLHSLQEANAHLEQRVLERTAELQKTNVELERANRIKDEFLTNMSHELRTPLNSVLGLSESLLEQRRGSLNDSQQNSLQIIQSSGQHLLELINDILDLSKIDAGKFDFYPEMIDLDDLCTSSLTFVKSQAIKKSITVKYIHETSAIQIYADPRRLKQILVNLLSNAVKFTNERGWVTLRVSDNVEQDLIQFSVSDNGIGIAKEDLPRLFQPFVQVDSRLNRQYEGTGLGLALVQKLTDLHGGSVQVESEPGKGSCFTISLYHQHIATSRSDTLGSSSSIATRDVSKTIQESIQPVHAGTVLLAEDHMANVLTVGEYLEAHGFQVVVAHDGLEAIEKARACHPDMILMDIQMPVLDGLDAIRRLRTDSCFASTPIIALTALAMPGDRERCIQAGANEYVSKPVSLKNLLMTIHAMLQTVNRETAMETK